MRISTVLSSVFALILSVPSSTASAKVDFVVDAEDAFKQSGDIIDNGIRFRDQRQGNTAPIAITDRYARRGGNSLVFNVFPNNPNGSENKERAEIYLTRRGPNYRTYPKLNPYPWGTERYTGFSVRLPSSFPRPENARFIIAQWWQNSPWKAPFFLELFERDGKLRIRGNLVRDKGTGVEQELFDRVMPTGRWVDVVVRLRSATGSNGGVVAVWLDRDGKGLRQVCYRSRTNVGFPGTNDVGLQQKVGIYRPSPGRVVSRDLLNQKIYIDQYKSATTFNEAKP